MYDLIINVFLIIILFYFCYSYLGYNLYEYSDNTKATDDENEEQNGVNVFANIIKNYTKSGGSEIIYKQSEEEQPEEDLSEEEQPEEDQPEEGQPEEDQSEEGKSEDQSEEQQEQSEEGKSEDQPEEQPEGQPEGQPDQSEDESYDELEEDNTIKSIINDLSNNFSTVATDGDYLTKEDYKDYINKQLVYIPNGNLSNDFINNSFNKCDIDKNKEISNTEIKNCNQSDNLLDLITY